MKREIIKEGTELHVEDGYIRITGANGSGLIYADQYFVDEDGTEKYIGERCLTASEIGLLMKAVDGQNHHIVYEGN